MRSRAFRRRSGAGWPRQGACRHGISGSGNDARYEPRPAVVEAGDPRPRVHTHNCGLLPTMRRDGLLGLEVDALMELRALLEVGGHLLHLLKRVDGPQGLPLLGATEPILRVSHPSCDEPQRRIVDVRDHTKGRPARVPPRPTGPPDPCCTPSHRPDADRGTCLPSSFVIYRACRRSVTD
jgi:hypothetical protein